MAVKSSKKKTARTRKTASRAKGVEARATFRDTDGRFYNWLLDDNGDGSDNVTTSTALKVAAVFACVRNISEDCAKLPLILYEHLEPRGKNRRRDLPLYRILHDEPNDEMSSFEFRQVMTQDLLLHGSGYAEIQRDGTGMTAALLYISADRVTVERDDGGAVVYMVRQNSGTRTPLRPDEMFHLKGPGDGMVGWSMIRLARVTIGAAMAADKFGSAWFHNGSHPSGVLEHPSHLKPDAAERLRKSWDAVHGGPNKSGKTAILEEGMKYNPLTIPPEDAQFLETKQFNVEDICRWYRMPPHKVQHLLRSTNNNIEHQSIEYVTDTLMSHLVRWEQEIKRKLIPRVGGENLFAEHLVAGMMRGDATARSAYYREQWNIGALSQNDIRELENLNPIGSDGDVYYVPMNMTPSNFAVKGPQPKPQAAPGNAAAVEALTQAHTTAIANRLRVRLKYESQRVNDAVRRGEGREWFADFYRGAAPKVRDDIVDVVDACATSFWFALTQRAMTPDAEAAISKETTVISVDHVTESVKEMDDDTAVKAWVSTRAAADAGRIVARIHQLIERLVTEL